MLGYSIVAYITVVVGVIAAWRLIELVRAPVPTRGRILVFALFASSFVSNAAANPIVQRQIDSVASGLSGLVSFVALFGFFVGFIIFFGGASPNSWYGRVPTQLAIVGAATALLVLAWALSLREHNTLQYLELPDHAPTGPALFSLVSNGYLFYTCLACAYLAAIEAARSSRSGRVAFALCAVGMGLCFVGGPLVRIPATLLAWTGTAMSPDEAGARFLHSTQGAPFVPILGSGILVVALGLIFVALRTLIGKTRLWLEAKRNSLALLPLWRDLTSVFPNIALHPGRTWLGEVFRLRDVPFSYERRVVECFDGLWRLSPYVEEPDDDSDDALPIHVQAALVHRAVRRAAAGMDPVGSPVAIAAAEDGQSSRALVALARCYSGATTDPNGQAEQVPVSA